MFYYFLGGWRSSESETATELGKPSSSSKGVISGKLAFEKTTCKICKEHFETVKLYKKVIQVFNK